MVKLFALYSISFMLVFQLMVTTLIWKETNLFAVMLIIQVFITTIAVWAAYKIANRMLLK